MARRAQTLPLIRYEIRGGELKPQARILVLEIPLGTPHRNREIRRLSKTVASKDLAAAFGLSIPQVWRIIRGLKSGRSNLGKPSGKTRR